jgi:hypothetical protein
MAENVGIGAASFFQGISKHGESVGVECAIRQVPLLIGGLGEADDGIVAPG